MNSKNRAEGSVTKSLLKDLADPSKATSKPTKQEPAVGTKPLDPPDLYQDSGGGYNPDFTSPQK